jgi:hypothetical protein
MAYLGPDLAGEVIRITVDPALIHPWEDFLLAHGVSPIEIFRLAQTGLEWGSNPERWFVTNGAIAVEQWVRVEEWNGERWERFDKPSRVTRRVPKNADSLCN